MNTPQTSLTGPYRGALSIEHGNGNVARYMGAMWHWAMLQNANGPQVWEQGKPAHYLVPPNDAPSHMLTLGYTPQQVWATYLQGVQILESLGYTIRPRFT